MPHVFVVFLSVTASAAHFAVGTKLSCSAICAFTAPAKAFRVGASPNASSDGSAGAEVSRVSLGMRDAHGSGADGVDDATVDTLAGDGGGVVDTSIPLVDDADIGTSVDRSAVTAFLAVSISAVFSVHRQAKLSKSQVLSTAHSKPGGGLNATASLHL